MDLGDYFYEIKEKEEKSFTEELLLKYWGVIGGIAGACAAYDLTKMDSEKLMTLIRMCMEPTKTDVADFEAYMSKNRQAKSSGTDAVDAENAVGDNGVMTQELPGVKITIRGEKNARIAAGILVASGYEVAASEVDPANPPPFAEMVSCVTLAVAESKDSSSDKASLKWSCYDEKDRHLKSLQIEVENGDDVRALASVFVMSGYGVSTMDNGQSGDRSVVRIEDVHKSGYMWE